MPDDIKPDEIQANNDEVKAKLEDQKLDDKSDPTFANASDALDKLAKQKEEERKDGTLPPEPGKAPEVAVKPPDDPEAAKQAEEAAKAKKALEDERLAAEERFKDLPQLPQGASPKSHEAFAAIKVKAAQDLAKKDEELAALKKQLAEKEEKLKSPVPKELLDELEDHRKFRAKMDVDADPKFKEFDKKVTGAREFIYSQFRKIPEVTDKTIKAIEDAGGPEAIDLDKFFESVKDPVMRRLVDAKLAEIETAKFEKSQAMKAAKEDVTTYLKEREESFQSRSKAHFEATRNELGQVLSEIDFMQDPKPDDPKAKEKQEYIEQNLASVRELLSDNSPQLRAVMIGGMLRLFHERKQAAETKKESDGLKAQVKELTTKLEKIKQSGASRLRDTGAPPSGEIPKPASSDVDFSARPGDAIDNLAKEIMAKKAAAGQV